MADFWVNGIVSQRDKQPYIQLSNENGMIAQLSMAQARAIAQNILVMASRTEMDAMLLHFMEVELKSSPQAGAAMMEMFRDYQARLDAEKIRGSSDGSIGEEPDLFDAD